MSHKIALSADISAFQYNRLLDETWARKFPGALWCSALVEVLGGRYQVVTADVAHSHVQSGYWSPKDVLVVQHTSDSISTDLVQRSCIPHIITAFESPLYAGSFYDNLETHTLNFQHQVLFRGSFSGLSCKGQQVPVTFPSFRWPLEVPEHNTWKNRKPIVMVFGNKYLPFLNFSFGPADWFWRFPRLAYQQLSGNKPATSLPLADLQLQDRRLELLTYFLEREQVSLFGIGWDRFDRLPPDWRQSLKPLLSSSDRKIDDKISCLRQFRFCLCLENCSYPGYVTEKIIDCLVAGVIPLYQGAPDIAEFIPAECFIDISQYSDLGELERRIDQMSEIEAFHMIEAGQDFLNSEKGYLHSYEGFASMIAELIRDVEV